MFIVKHEHFCYIFFLKNMVKNIYLWLHLHTLPVSHFYKYYINQYTFLEVIFYINARILINCSICQNHSAIFMCPLQKQTFQYSVQEHKRIILIFTVSSESQTIYFYQYMDIRFQCQFPILPSSCMKVGKDQQHQQILMFLIYKLCLLIPFSNNHCMGKNVSMGSEKGQLQDNILYMVKKNRYQHKKKKIQDGGRRVVWSAGLKR